MFGWGKSDREKRIEDTKKALKVQPNDIYLEKTIVDLNLEIVDPYAKEFKDMRKHFEEAGKYLRSILESEKIFINQIEFQFMVGRYVNICSKLNEKEEITQIVGSVYACIDQYLIDFINRYATKEGTLDKTKIKDREILTKARETVQWYKKLCSSTSLPATMRDCPKELLEDIVKENKPAQVSSAPESV